MDRNIVIVDSDSISAFILQRSLELLVPEQRFTINVVARLTDFHDDLTSSSGRNILENLHWVIIDTKYIWEERPTLMDVLRFVRTHAPSRKLIITTEYFSKNLYHAILSENLVDEIVIKPFGQDSLRKLVTSCREIHDIP